MNVLVTIGYVLIGIGVTLLLVGSLFLIAFRHYGMKLMLNMPLMQWVTFDEVVSIGCPKFMAVIILGGLAAAEIVEIRASKEYEDFLISQAWSQLTEAELDELEEIEIELSFTFSTAQRLEYRLRFRPRRQRRMRFKLPEMGLVGVPIRI